MSSPHPRSSLRQSSPSTSTTSASNGSQTITQPANPTLRLRGQRTPSAPSAPSTSSSSRRHIQWDASVVDNEGMGKKSSKVCCIYHKPHEPGDSESESDSSSSSDDDSGGEDLSRAQRAGRGMGRRKGGEGGGSAGGEGGEQGKGKAKERKASPNAYERQPKAKGKKEG